MQRITHQDLLTIIATTLKTAPSHAKRGLLSDSPIEVEAAIHELAGRIASQIENEGPIVIEAESRTNGTSSREWGEEEPEPCS